MQSQTKSYLFAFAAVLCWSTVATAFKISLEHLSILQLLFISSWTAFLVLFLIRLPKGVKSVISEISDITTFKSAIMGFLNPFLYYIILFYAYDSLRAQEALSLNYTWAIMVVLFSIPILKQKVKISELSALLISFIGVIIIATNGDILSLNFSNGLGTLAAISTSVIWALYWVLNAKDKRDDLLKILLNFFFGSIYITLAMFIVGERLPQFILCLPALYVGIFEMGITFLLWALALKYSVSTAKVSNLVFLSPFLSLFFINIILGEAILVSTIIGLIFIISGVVLQKTIKSKQ